MHWQLESARRISGALFPDRFETYQELLKAAGYRTLRQALGNWPAAKRRSEELAGKRYESYRKA